MATAVASDSPLAALLRKYAPSTLPASPSASTNEYSAADISKSLFPDTHLSEAEKEEQSAWLTTSAHIASSDEDQAKTAERLAHLNTHLATRTTILGTKPSLADIALYAKLAPVITNWSRDERTGEQGYHHIVRHAAFVQVSPLFGVNIDPQHRIQIDENDVAVPIKPIDAKAEKEKKKKKDQEAAAATPTQQANGAPSGQTGAAAAATAAETAATVPEAAANDTPNATPAVSGGGRKAKKEAKAAAAGAGGPDEDAGKKKEKPKKQPPPPKDPPRPLSPAMIDLRVGHILKAEPHPNADSLYVSTIACGDAPGTDNTSEYEGQVVRTVCSGLNGLIPLEEMQNRKIVAVCNLKPVTMRGVKSAAMVLAASPRAKEGEDDHKGPVELVSPPADAKAGDRVLFEGWEGEPEAVLNPKKKVWESCQVGFTTTDSCEIAFDAGAVEQLEGKTGLGLLKTGGQVCTVNTLKGATVR